MKMKIIKSGLKYMIEKLKLFFRFLPDKTYIKIYYFLKFKKVCDLDNPTTFNEKIQWLKLYDRNPLYTTLVDKVEVKKYVTDKIGKDYIIPTLGVWDDPEKIDLNSLPNQFVLKCNHDSGKVFICTDKLTFDFEDSKKHLKKLLEQDYYMIGREWPYKNVKRKILAEKYMVDDTEGLNKELSDYKFMCFNGKVKCIFTGTERFSKSGLKVTFFDLEWNVLPFERGYKKSQNAEEIKKPKNFELMIKLAEQLASDIPFVRVDFYECNDKVFFGELTFYPGCGFEKFNPTEWDKIIGSWLELPERSGYGSN